MKDVRTTRQTLIQRLKDVGNDEAWKEFYDFYKQSIIGWAVHYQHHQQQLYLPICHMT